MKTLRVAAAALGLVALAYGVWWGRAMMGWTNPAIALPLSFGATIAAMLWWFALRGEDPVSRAGMRFGCLGGLVVGGIAFLAGFIAPIILKPQANQGPLLGIFITGPAGFVLGTAVAVAIKKLRGR